MFRFKHRGDFKHTEAFLKRSSQQNYRNIFTTYGQMGVRALSKATPVATGKTAMSWSYDIEQANDKTTISFKNTNVNNGVNIAVILQYGHGTKNGGYVQGRDYINPAIQPVFDQMIENFWREITKP